jgi:hypothetical protein
MTATASADRDASSTTRTLLSCGAVEPGSCTWRGLTTRDRARTPPGNRRAWGPALRERHDHHGARITICR